MLRFLVLATTSFLSIAQLAQASFGRAPTKTGDYCLDQGFEVLRKRFGADHDISFKYTVGESPRVSNALQYAYTISDLCSGNFYLSTGAGVDIQNCTNVHYGRVPQKFVGIEADGQCKEILPHSEPVE